MTFNPKDFTADQLDTMNLVGTLTGKTQKGKQRLKQWGNRGSVLRVLTQLPCGSNDGLWFAVCAGDPTFRWLNFGNDKDFDMVVTPWADDDDFLVPKTHANFEG